MEDKDIGAASVDGVISSLGNAKISVMDRGFLYGDSIYEVIRTFDGTPLFFDEHWNRFKNSAKLVNLKLSFSKQELLVEIRKIFDEVKLPKDIDFYIRYIVTRGQGSIDLFPHSNLNQSLIVIVKKMRSWEEVFYRRGIKLAVPQIKRNSINTLDPNIKGGNYLNNILGLMSSRELGADDCLMLNEGGHITESSSSNIFFVIKNNLVTPSKSSGNLNGLTKCAVQEICKNKGIENSEIYIDLNMIDQANECFITSSTRGIMPVASIILSNGKVIKFPDGGGKYTRKLISYYEDYLNNYVASNKDFLLYKKL